MRSNCGHRMTGQLAKAFSSAYVPRDVVLWPGSFVSLRSDAQSRKALLAMYCSEGGIAGSGSAAQFIKALIVCTECGSLTSLRLAQCTKLNSWISSMLEFEISTCLSSLQLSQACAPSTWKSRVNSSVVIPVELRHPGGNSLASSFFPRVRTPCGRSAQVIIESMGTLQVGGGREQKTPNQNPKHTTKNNKPNPKTHTQKQQTTTKAPNPI